MKRGRALPHQAEMELKARHDMARQCVIKHGVSWDFFSPSLMMNTLGKSRRTNKHKIGRLFFISLNIGDYNVELPYI